MISRRKFCLSVALAAAAAPAALTQTAPPAPETNADLPAQTLYAIGTRMLREGRTYEKAAAVFGLAGEKEPENPAHQMGLGCALASRAASLGYAALFTQMQALEQADYPEKLKKWENGRAEFETMKAQDPEGMGKMNYDDWKPAPPPPIRGFVTKDDNLPFRLTMAQTIDRVAELSTQARQAWETGIALCKTSQEKAEALYVQAWGLRILHDYLSGLGTDTPYRPFAEDSEDVSGSDANNTPSKGAAAEKSPFAPSLVLVVNSIKEAIRLEPNNALYMQAHGDFLMGSSKEKAVAVYEKAVILAPKNSDLLYLLYKNSVEKELAKFNQEGGTKPNADPFALSLRYLHRAQARDRANAWPLYEEAALLFRLAPYSVTGPSGDRSATPEQKQKLLQAVQNKEARQRGKQAVDRMAQGNGLPRYEVPRYEDSVPRLLSQAWRMNVIRLLGANDFSGFGRLRELARSAVGYGQVMGQHENNEAEAVRANRACIGMGFRLIGDWSTEDDIAKGKTVILSLVGMAMCAVGYKGLIEAYQTAGNLAGANAAQKESDAFSARTADYNKARKAKIKNETIYGYY